jgi:N-acetylmuramoyl-L-alanine amidase
MSAVSNPLPARKREKKAASSFSLWRALQTVFSAGLLVASLLTFWTPANLFSNNIMERMLRSLQSAAAPTREASALPNSAPANDIIRVGIVAGHWENDSGAFCQDDGLTEVEVNLDIASRVSDILKKNGFEVDLLREFDPLLSNYQAVALVSIHNDSCDYYGDEATGYKVAGAQVSPQPQKTNRLVACLTQRYNQATGLPYHINTVTIDMTDYHAFDEINPNTPAAIIETGFLNLDREILTQHTDKVAQGVADGILCYIRNEDIPDSPVTAP